jgi:hypothetical protein
MTLEELGATVGTVLGSATIAWFAGVKNLVMPKSSQSTNNPTSPTSKKDQSKCDGECFLEVEMTGLSNELVKTNKEVTALSGAVKNLADSVETLSHTMNAGFTQLKSELSTLRTSTAINEAKQEIYKENVESLFETTNLIARDLSNLTGQLSILVDKDLTNRRKNH